MAQASGAENVGKAFFKDLDGGNVFTVQFNPKELKLDEKASWKPSEEHGQSQPLLTYEKGEPTSLSMELIFDTTDTPSVSVNSKFIQPLRDFMTARYKDDAVAADIDAEKSNIRPCYCKFQWGSQFTFDGVIEKVNATYLMFASDGTPLRAKVTVGMKERNRAVAAGGGGGVTLTAGGIVAGAQTVDQVTGNVTTYTVQEGDTATSVANATGADERDIMHANNLPNPISLTPGELLVIPATSKLADVLSKQGQKENRGKWKDTEARDPFAESRAQAGQAPGPSALEESNPVGLGYGEDAGDVANAYISFGSYEGGEIDSNEAIGEYGATGAGDGVGAHTQNGANPYAQGETGTALGYDSEVGDGSIGEYGATGAGDGVGAHTQNGANPVGQGETGEALGYDSEVGDGAVGEFGATGAGDGVGAHTQNGANPVGQGETGEALGYDSEVGDNGNGYLGGKGAGAGATGDGSDAAVGEFGRGGAAEGVGGHSSNGPGEGMAGGGRAGAAEGVRGGGGAGDGGGAGSGAGGAGAGAGAAADAAGGGEGARGAAGEIDVDTEQMREDNAEGKVDGPAGGGGRRRGADGARGEGGGEGGAGDGAAGGNASRDGAGGRKGAGGGRRGNRPGDGRADAGGGAVAGEAGADVAGKGGSDVTGKDVARKIAHKTGEKPDNKEEVRRAAGSMGLGEAIRQGKENVDDNQGDE